MAVVSEGWVYKLTDTIPAVNVSMETLNNAFCRTVEAKE